MKKLLAILLALTLVMSTAAVAFAASDDEGFIPDEIFADDNDDPILGETFYEDDEDDEDEDALDIGISAIECTPKHTIYIIDEEGFDVSLIKNTYIKINGKKYNATYLKNYKDDSESYEDNVVCKATYNAKVGDLVEMFFETTDGQVFTDDTEIAEGDDDVCIEICNTKGTLFTYDSEFDDVRTVEATLNGKKVKVQNYKGNDADSYNLSGSKHFRIYAIYYKGKKNDKVTVKVTTENNYVYTDSASAVNLPIEVKINNFYSGDKVLKGTTTPGATLKFTGAFKGSVKASANGNFSINTAAIKANKTIKIKATCAGFPSSTTTYKVLKTKSTITISGKVTKKSSSVKFTVNNAKVGDYVIVKIKKATFRSATLKKASGKATITVKIKKQKKGTKINAGLYDVFDSKKGSVSAKVVK